MARVAALRRRGVGREILERIREAWESGVVVLPDHAEERFESSGLSDAEIRNVLKHGRIIKIETPIRLARYSIRGESVDGADVICAVELDGAALIIVTVFEETQPP